MLQQLQFFWHLDTKINYCNLFQRFKRQKFRHFVLKMLRLPPERFLENTLKECLEVSWMRDQTESTLEGTPKNQFLGCWQDLQESCRPEDPSAVQLIWYLSGLPQCINTSCGLFTWWMRKTNQTDFGNHSNPKVYNLIKDYLGLLDNKNSSVEAKVTFSLTKHL